MLSNSDKIMKIMIQHLPEITYMLQIQGIINLRPGSLVPYPDVNHNFQINFFGDENHKKESTLCVCFENKTANYS